MADLVADISEAEQRTIQAQKESSQNQRPPTSLEMPDFSGAGALGYGANVAAVSVSHYEYDLPPPPADPMVDLPPPPPPPEPLSQVSVWGKDGRTLHSATSASHDLWLSSKRTVTFISLWSSEILKKQGYQVHSLQSQNPPWKDIGVYKEYYWGRIQEWIELG